MPLRLWLVILSFAVVAVMTPSALAQTSAVDRPAELRCWHLRQLWESRRSPGEPGHHQR